VTLTSAHRVVAFNQESSFMSQHDDTFREEASAFGQRVKGAAKDAAGAVTGDSRLEREGEIENAAGRARQASNDVFDETDGAPGATVREDRWVAGIYAPDQARTAYDTMADRYGYGPDDVNIAMSDETRKRYFSDDSSASKAAETAGKGGGIGMGVGAALGAIVATASAVTLPGVGLVIAGPLAGAIAGAGGGAAAGTIIGALVGSAIPKERAAEYEQAVRDGDVVLSARARDERHSEELEREMTSYGGRQIFR
jgi:uncharacterized protein YjbJ (UPF0337 family)